MFQHACPYPRFLEKLNFFYPVGTAMKLEFGQETFSKSHNGVLI